MRELNILVSRTDRLGDVLLATPVLKKIREKYPEAKITFLVAKPWVDLLQYGNPIDVMEFSPEKWGANPTEALAELFRARKFNVAIVLHDEKMVSMAVKKAAIPVRIGNYRTLRSFFTFNRGMLQKRSQCKMHEAEYNLQLLDRFSSRKSARMRAPALKTENLPRAWIRYPLKAQEAVQIWLAHNNITPGKFIAIHPGSSGSSRYLSMQKITALVHELYHQKKVQVVLTGGPNESDLLTLIATKAKLPLTHLFMSEGEPKPLSQLAELYRAALGVVAHGTGPLHLAAASDTNVMAIFPPLFVLSEKRWGPLTSKRIVWTPAVPCPEKYKCRGEKCTFFDCMDRFAIDEAVKQILKWGKGNP